MPDFSLDAKYRQQEGTVFLSGIQALVRLPFDQHHADKRRGLNTATLISGYRGSPLGGLDLTLERNPELLRDHHVVFVSGVNAPEVHHPRKGEEPGGREAAAVNRALVDGQAVRLETDVRSRDRYGRLLAYVWIGDTMINAELVRRGYAQVMTVPPNVKHQALFLKLQREAREARRGLWRDTAALVAP